MQNDPIQPSDIEIIHRVLNGDANAFESLLIRYKDMVLKIVKKHVPYNEVEETTQNVFLRAYQSLPTFKGKSGFKQWLSSIAVRTCYDFWRKTYRSREVPMSVLTEKHQKWLENVITEQSEQAINERGSQDEAKELLDWALRRLSAEDKMVVELVYLEGLSGKEAADLLGWSIANVKIRCFRSRKKLEKILEEARQQ
jgi:RNA polymerase sigma-70 factor (ECF subfamily)